MHTDPHAAPRATATASLLACTLAAACGRSDPYTLGPSGGTINFADGTTLTVPEGALDEATTFSLTTAAPSSEGALGQAYTLMPAGLRFARPATVYLPYERTAYLPADFVEPVSVASGTDDLGGVIESGYIHAATSTTGTFTVRTTTAPALASGQGYPQGLAVSPSGIYFSNAGSRDLPATFGFGDVMVLSRTAPPALHTVARAIPTPRRLAVSGDRVYVTSGGTGVGHEGSGVYGAPIGGGPATLLLTSPDPQGVAFAGRYIFFSDNQLQGVMRADADGANVRVLAASTVRPESLLGDGEWVYWISRGTLGNSDGAVLRVPVAGGAAVTLASAQDDPADLCLDDEAVYWVNKGDGRVQRVPRSGGVVTTLRTLPRPNAIAVTATQIFVADVITGRLLRFPKVVGAGAVRTDAGGHVRRLLVDGDDLVWLTEGAAMNEGTLRRIAQAP